MPDVATIASTTQDIWTGYSLPISMAVAAIGALIPFEIDRRRQDRASSARRKHKPPRS